MQKQNFNVFRTLMFILAFKCLVFESMHEKKTQFQPLHKTKQEYLFLFLINVLTSWLRNIVKDNC